MKNVLFFSFLFFFEMSFGQGLLIADVQTQQGIPFVEVFSTTSRTHVMGDEKGYVDIDDFQNSENLIFRALGYHSKKVPMMDLMQMDRFYLEKALINLDEIVVTASRWQQNSNNVPARIITVSPQEVAFQNPQTAADLLGSSGWVFVQKSQQGGGSPMIRGFATNRLLYAVDGVRMNNAIFRGGNIQNVINLDPFATEGTEVIFGPGSLIYGSDAIGGVMSFQTLKTRYSKSDTTLVGGKGVVRFSTANKEKTTHLDYNIGLKNWSFVGSFSHWQFDHLRQGRFGPPDYVKSSYVGRIDGRDSVLVQEDTLLQIPSAYDQVNIMQKVGYRLGPKADLTYAFHHSGTSPYGRYDRHNRSRNGLPRYGRWDYGPQRWTMHFLEARFSQSTLLYDEASWRFARQGFEESRLDRSYQGEWETRALEQVMATSFNVDLRKKMRGGHQVFYGIEGVWNDVTSVAIQHNIVTQEERDAPPRYPGAKWSSLAAYLQDEWILSRSWVLQGGLRWNSSKMEAEFETQFYPFPFRRADVKDDGLTGSLGVVWRPTDTWVVRSNAGTAFRMPNVDDIGKVFDSEPGAVTVPNPELQSEYAYNLDLNVIKILWDRVKLDFTGYCTFLDRAIVRRDYTLNGQDTIVYDGVPSKVQALQNASEARIVGVQADVEMKLGREWTLMSVYNFQKGEETLDDGSKSPTRHAAPAFGMTRLTYEKDRWKYQVYATYQAERKADDMPFEERSKDEIYAKDDGGSNYAPAWCTLNAKAQWKAGAVSIQAGVENILDRRYRPFSSGISGPGRNFILSVQFNL